MPYTNPWDSNSPPGTQAANTADDEFRKLRLDLEERLEDKFVNDITADPLVVKPEILGNVVGKTIFIDYSNFTTPDADLAAPGNALFVRGGAGLLYVEHAIGDANLRILQASLVIPVSCTITQLASLVNRNGSTNMNVFLDYVSFDAAPAITGVTSNTTTVNGISLLTTASSHLVAANRMYRLSVDFPASQAARLYGVRITYTTPDCRNTL